ncbi:MAG: CarD family transcriptional regulator, partial [Actinomycetota bacterium]
MSRISGLIAPSTKTLDHIEDSDVLIAPAPLFSQLIAQRAQEKKLVVVTHSSKRSAELVRELSGYFDGVREFPSWETLPHEKLSPNGDTIARRIEVLHSIKDIPILVVPIRAFVQPIVSNVLEKPSLELRKNERLEFEELVRSLVERAYSRVDLVERRGEFAVRGGIIDIFPTGRDYPVRVEFFGDEIEEIRSFEIANQRTFQDEVGAISILPGRELLIDSMVRERADALRHLYPELLEMCSKISEGIYPPGMESIVGALYPETKLLIDFLDDSYEVILLEDERIRNRSLDLIKTSEEFLEAAWSNAALDGNVPLRSELQRAGYVRLSDVEENAKKRKIRWRSLNLFGDAEDAKLDQYREAPSYRGDIEKLISDVRIAVKDSKSVVLSFHGHGLTERYLQLLSEGDIPARIMTDISTPPKTEIVSLIQSPIEFGYEDLVNRVLLITEADITGTRDRRATSKMPTRRKKAIDPLELKRGDYVVHEIHGVGRYQELIKRKVLGVEREYVVIEYAPSKRGQPADRIFVPTDSLDLVTSYIGGETPTLHKIGGG